MIAQPIGLSIISGLLAFLGGFSILMLGFILGELRAIRRAVEAK